MWQDNQALMPYVKFTSRLRDSRGFERFVSRCCVLSWLQVVLSVATSGFKKAKKTNLIT